MFRVCAYAALLSVILFLASCQGTRRTIYFDKNTQPDSTALIQDIGAQNSARIKPGDIIAISVASVSFLPDDRPNQVFLEGGIQFVTDGVGSSGGMNSGRNSYLVDSAGFIDYPRIGRLKLAGLTVPEAKDQMAARLKDYLKQPTVEVRIVNYRITMLGEIVRPGPLYTANHAITIVDAVARAGGIPITGRMENVLVIRESNGKREFGHVDLNSRNVFNSPYYYLQQNDIVYVEPSKIRRQDANQFLRLYLPAITTIVSAALTVFAVVQVAKANQ